MAKQADFVGGGPLSALRAYRAYHPGAAVYDVTYRNRTVWMTAKQFSIWCECQKYWKRGKHDTLGRIAQDLRCSKSTVSRFLRRLDQWRFINLVTIPGRNGGTYILTRPYNEKPRIWTKAERYRARFRLAAQYRRKRLSEEVQKLIDEYRRTHPYRTMRGLWWDEAPKVGNTGATFRDTYGARRRHA